MADFTPGAVLGATDLEAAINLIETNAQTGTAYSPVLSDIAKMIEMNNAAPNTLTVNPDVTTSFPVGAQIALLQTGAGQTTVAAGVGVTVNGSPGLKLRGQWSMAVLIKRAANTWVLVGDTSA